MKTYFFLLIWNLLLEWFSYISICFPYFFRFLADSSLMPCQAFVRFISSPYLHPKFSFFLPTGPHFVKKLFRCHLLNMLKSFVCLWVPFVSFRYPIIFVRILSLNITKSLLWLSAIFQGSLYQWAMLNMRAHMYMYICENSRIQTSL